MSDLWTPEEDQGHIEGAVGRLLDAITVGAPQKMRRKDALEAQHKLREIEQQFQFEISGVATKTLTFEEVTVPFDYNYYYAPGQRESNLDFPHFTFGSQTNPSVGVHATISQWMRDQPDGSINGAVVAVGAHGNNQAFTGVVHLTFQGFGALIEEGEEEGAE